MDGSLIAAGTDLDCATARQSTASDAVTYITGLGSMPYGRIRVASGSGTRFTDFGELDPHFVAPTFATTPSVAAWTTDGNYQIFVTNSGSAGEPTGVMLVDEQDNQFRSSWPDSEASPVPPSLVSGVDVTDWGLGNSQEWTIAGINEDGDLQLLDHRYFYGETDGWYGPEYFPPPSQRTLQYSPAVCGYPGSSAAMHTYIVVTAGDRLWYTVNKDAMASSGFSAWRQLSDVPVSSAPDCYFCDDLVGDSQHGLIHVVALTAAGGVLHVEGQDGGGFTETDLGAY